MFSSILNPKTQMTPWLLAFETVAGEEDNPLSPALRSGPTAGSGAIRQKQIPSSRFDP